MSFRMGSGSVAKKIALFQLEGRGGEKGPGPRLRRKDAIKRKKGSSSLSSSNLSCSDSENQSSGSPGGSSAEYYGTGRPRPLKDSYQTVSLPRLGASLHLVEFRELDLAGSEEEEEPFYEELDLGHLDLQPGTPPRHEAEARRDGEDEDDGGSGPPSESLYSEPIYGGTTSSGGSSTYWTPSLYGGGAERGPEPPALGPGRSRSLDLGGQGPWANPGLRPSLPPLPATPSKFSSLARSAGKRLVKKLQQVRRLSRVSLADLPGKEGAGVPVGPTPPPLPALRPLPLRRPVSRPLVPPPAPPPVPRTEPVYGGDSEEDFEDSDFYDSDSELIKNFVAAVQPIYSMDEEPLYQYYTYGISLQPEDDYQPVIPKNLGLSLDMLVPRMGQRTLWCEIPAVQSSGILGILSEPQKQLQEAIFEILTSEVSYLKSLDVLISLFYDNAEMGQVLSETDRAALFGNITAVKEAASGFLGELLGKWEESWYITEVGRLVQTNATSRFGVYKDYCRNKPYQDRTLQRLRQTRDDFVHLVKAIEEDPKCQLLRMDSFLMLPMQRITRLPLLVNAVLQRTVGPKDRGPAEEALNSLTNLVIECNEAARESQDAEETAVMLERLEFPRGLPPVLNPGHFVLKGDFMKNPFETGSKKNWTFTKNKRAFYWLILFTHKLFITKKRSSGKLEVVEMVSPSDVELKPLPNLEGISKDFNHYFMLHFEDRETVHFLGARTQSEVDRWRKKLEEVKVRKDTTLEAIFRYEAKREDELSFEVGDAISVSQMQPDGWYFGQKKGTGEEGWFPANYCASPKATTS